ncbi:MAG TPA: hypothetical protein VI451_14515 [Anaerolineales bacterium]|nr:hypothetical protein [Anaerolineales bacterium]
MGIRNSFTKFYILIIIFGVTPQAKREGQFRPLAETVRDTLAWAKTRPADWEWRAGLNPKREAELLHKWATK